MLLNDELKLSPHLPLQDTYDYIENIYQIVKKRKIKDDNFQKALNKLHQKNRIYGKSIDSLKTAENFERWKEVLNHVMRGLHSMALSYHFSDIGGCKNYADRIVDYLEDHNIQEEETNYIPHHRFIKGFKNKLLTLDFQIAISKIPNMKEFYKMFVSAYNHYEDAEEKCRIEFSQDPNKLNTVHLKKETTKWLNTCVLGYIAIVKSLGNKECQIAFDELKELVDKYNETGFERYHKLIQLII